MDTSRHISFRFEHLKMLEPYMEQIREHFDKECSGISAGISYFKGKGVSMSFMPNCGEHGNGFIIDGRGLYYTIDPSMTRFSQKRFDALVERYKMILPHVATLYTFFHMIDSSHQRNKEWTESLNVICSFMSDIKAAQDVAVGQINSVLDKIQLAEDDCVGEIVDDPRNLDEEEDEDWDKMINAGVLKEVKPNNKKEMETPSIQIQPGVTIANTPEMESKLAERINNAIVNDGECIHNCTREDESWAVPIKCKVRELHPDVNPTECDFIGWPKFKSGVMISFAIPQNVALAPAKLRENGFSDEFRNFFFPEHQNMLAADCAAIRIETEDGKFLEYVVSKSA